MDSLNGRKERISYWDNIKGLLIAFVVLAHCLYAFQDRRLIDVIVDSIYFFHMPAFVFVSGFFSKSENSRSAKSLLRLFVSYLALTGVHLLIALVMGHDLQITIPYYSAWYLLAVIVWRIVTPYFSKIKGIIPIVCVISLLAGFWNEINNTFAFARIISLYPFFLAGYFLSKERAGKLIGTPYGRRFPLGVGFLAAGGATAAATKYFLRPEDGDFMFSYYKSGYVDGILTRLAIFCVASLCIAGLLCASPERKLPLLTKWGKNSLAIYLIHRPVTLVLNHIIGRFSTKILIPAAVVSTVVILALAGTDFVTRLMNRVLDFFADGLISVGNRIASGRWQKILCLILVLCIVAAPAARAAFDRLRSRGTTETDGFFRVDDDGKAREFENAFRLLFAGDLILLEDQVKNAFNGEDYDFSECFEYTKKYIESADLAIGVFEGPCAGNENTTYSSSNYGDGKTLFVNFPDAWAYAVKDAGFDYVTTANNHVLDRGKEGAARTLGVLDAAGLMHSGSYSGAEDKEANRVWLIEAGGMRFAVLTYTNQVNGYRQDAMFEKDNSYVTSMIVDKGSSHYDECLASVKKDFEKAAELNPDLIIVLPHWGTQFADYPNSFQLLWEENFKSLGADIILGDHTHSVQPVGMSKEDGRSVLTLYCPGNYANIYREYDGDFSSMVEVYVDRTEKKVIGGAVIPMWTASSYTGNYRPLPIYDVMTDPGLGSLVSTRDIERVAEAQEHITEVMLGEKVGIYLLQEKFCFDERGFFRVKNTSVDVTGDMTGSVMYKALTEAKNVCFVGDSLTEGTKNGGVPWYEPLKELVKGKITNCGWGSATVKVLLDSHIDEIKKADADLFVVAIGTNDVRYRNKKTCAMDAETYVERLGELRSEILEANAGAKFVFIAPWYSTDGDSVSRLEYADKLKMNDEYTEALGNWAKSNGDGFVNANPYLRTMLDLYPHGDFMVDYIHPNGNRGVELYSRAVLGYTG
ncbi:MAG: CapA family protein [Clostridia bacterium]|nr:CapA family protein [Clostridia bacterium]